jgi:hypothetical protein
LEVQMETKRKSNSVVTTQQTDDGRLVIAVLGAGTVDFNPALAHADNRAHAEVHGWIQRLSDRAAMSRNPETGKPATPAEKFNAIKALAEYYMTGATEWALSGGGGGGGGKSLTVEAIARVKGIGYEAAQALVEQFAEAKHGGDVKAALAFLRSGKRVMEAMEAIRRERAAAPRIDADKAVDELTA